ncbi:MAG: cation acetate symporter [Telmatospirillum sp.]|nr:cation acetate symporter [Telmatospirillum sp.]
MRGDFTQTMGRIFFIYIGGCLLAATILVILSLAGVSDHAVGVAFILLTVAFYAVMGLLGRSARRAELTDYDVAGRHVPAFYNGMATAADWMSAASFIGLAGAIFLRGFDGLAYPIGWTAGYVLVAVLLAPFLRKFGQFTVPDFLAARYGGRVPRLIAAVILLSVSFLYVVAQMSATGLIAARFLGLDFPVAVFVGLAGILACSALGGMRALIWTQVAQYVVVLVAYLLPAVWLSQRVAGIPVPQIAYGRALDRLAGLGVLDGSWLTLGDGVNFCGVIFCLMLGTASLPHVLSRCLTTPSVRESRLSVAWSLLFLLLLYTAAPALAAFAKLELANLGADPSIDGAGGWFSAWQRIGLVARAAAGDGPAIGGLIIDPDAVVLAMPEIAGLPFVVAALVAAGALAATLSSADGLLLTIGKAAAHDLPGNGGRSGISSGRRLAVARMAMAVAAVLAAWTASARPAGILTIVAWAFSLAASGLFPALVLGIWWKRATGPGALAGMLAGWSVAAVYILGLKTGVISPVGGIGDVAAGVFGVPVAAAMTVAVSLLTPPPSARIQAFVDQIRIPRGRITLPEGD